MDVVIFVRPSVYIEDSSSFISCFSVSCIVFIMCNLIFMFLHLTQGAAYDLRVPSILCLLHLISDLCISTITFKKYWDTLELSSVVYAGNFWSDAFSLLLFNNLTGFFHGIWNNHHFHCEGSQLGRNDRIR